MIIKELTYKDVFTYDEITRKFYFHISSADAVKLVIKYAGAGEADKDFSLETVLKEIIAAGDTNQSLNVIEELIRASVGYRTADGLFAKSKEYADAFIASEAYGELMGKILTDEKFAEKFFSGMVGVQENQNGQKQQLKSVAHKSQKNRHKNNRG